MNKFIGKLLLLFRISDYKVVMIEDNPSECDISKNTIYIVGGINYVKWVYFRCPCGCNQVLMLSLSKNKFPSWSISLDKYNRPTIYPSVDVKFGCYSHFWLKKGKIIWANN